MSSKHDNIFSLKGQKKTLEHIYINMHGPVRRLERVPESSRILTGGTKLLKRTLENCSCKSI